MRDDFPAPRLGLSCVAGSAIRGRRGLGSGSGSVRAWTTDGESRTSSGPTSRASASRGTNSRTARGSASPPWTSCWSGCSPTARSRWWKPRPAWCCGPGRRAGGARRPPGTIAATGAEDARPPSPCCPSPTWASDPGRTGSPTASPRTSSPTSRGCAGCSSSRAIRPSPTRAARWTCAQVARDLGVRYVLEGSVRVAGGRIRVTGQLIDAATGKHIWAERYDRELADIFAVQDEITRNVVAAIEPHLYAEEGYRAAARPTGEPGCLGPRGARHGADQPVGRRAERGGAAAARGAPSRSSRATPAPMRCSPGPAGGRRCATGGPTPPRATARRRAMRRRPWRSTPPSPGRAWRMASA